MHRSIRRVYVHIRAKRAVVAAGRLSAAARFTVHPERRTGILNRDGPVLRCARLRRTQLWRTRLWRTRLWRTRQCRLRYLRRAVRRHVPRFDGAHERLGQRARLHLSDDRPGRRTTRHLGGGSGDVNTRWRKPCVPASDGGPVLGVRADRNHRCPGGPGHVGRCGDRRRYRAHRHRKAKSANFHIRSRRHCVRFRVLTTRWRSTAGTATLEQRHLQFRHGRRRRRHKRRRDLPLQRCHSTAIRLVDLHRQRPARPRQFGHRFVDQHQRIGGLDGTAPRHRQAPSPMLYRRPT